MKSMNLARVSSNGQITLPLEVRQRLSIKAGNKILFTVNDRGEVVISNASASALDRAQKAFAGVAEKLEVKDANDVQKLVDGIRHG